MISVRTTDGTSSGPGGEERRSRTSMNAAENPLNSPLFISPERSPQKGPSHGSSPQQEQPNGRSSEYLARGFIRAAQFFSEMAFWSVAGTFAAVGVGLVGGIIVNAVGGLGALGGLPGAEALAHGASWVLGHLSLGLLTGAGMTGASFGLKLGCDRLAEYFRKNR